MDWHSDKDSVKLLGVRQGDGQLLVDYVLEAENKLDVTMSDDKMKDTESD